MVGKVPERIAQIRVGGTFAGHPDGFPISRQDLFQRIDGESATYRPEALAKGTDRCAPGRIRAFFHLVLRPGVSGMPEPFPARFRLRL